MARTVISPGLAGATDHEIGDTDRRAETTGTVSGSLDGKVIVVGWTWRTCAVAGRAQPNIAAVARTAMATRTTSGRRNA